MPDWDQGTSGFENTRVTPGQAGRHQLQLDSIVGGSYRLKSIVGRGGMGVVYLAEHVIMKRDYALKALAADQINEANWSRFQAEGKAIAKIEHCNIVKIYDMGIEGGEVPFYVMDLLEGPSLAQFIRVNGPLTVDQAIDVFTQICDGLGYAHKCGIIHRDVKPSNIILTGLNDADDKSLKPSGNGFDGRSPEVKIVDFGLAKLVGDMAQLNQFQTAVGEVFGSPFYMSPEQCLGGKIDERSDVYSLGCSLFQSLTGHHPFCGESALHTVMMHKNDKPPSLSDVCSDREFLPECEQLIALMLKKRPAERPQSMGEVAHDLARIKEGKSVKPRAIFAEAPLFVLEQAPVDSPSRSNKPLLYSGAAIFVILTAVAIFICSQQGQKSVAPAAQVNAEIVENTEEPSGESEDIAYARKVFENCTTISNGIVNEGGSQKRIFRFPSVSLGLLSYGDTGVRMPAKGTLKLPPKPIVTLWVMPPAGKYTLAAPGILSKIGKDDIDTLNLNLTRQLGDEDLKPQLFEAISQWFGLHSISINGGKLSKNAVLALNDINPIDNLRLRNVEVDGNDLAQVHWLNGLSLLDFKGGHNVSKVMEMLSHSNNLSVLHIDETDPSLAALQGLANCPKLTKLAFSDCEIDDKKLEAICNITSVVNLVLNNNPIAGHSLAHLSKLKHLASLSLKGTKVSPSDIEELRRRLPECTIEAP